MTRIMKSINSSYKLVLGNALSTNIFFHLFIMIYNIHNQ